MYGRTNVSGGSGGDCWDLVRPNKEGTSVSFVADNELYQLVIGYRNNYSDNYPEIGQYNFDTRQYTKLYGTTISIPNDYNVIKLKSTDSEHVFFINGLSYPGSYKYSESHIVKILKNGLSFSITKSLINSTNIDHGSGTKSLVLPNGDILLIHVYDRSYSKSYLLIDSITNVDGEYKYTHIVSTEGQKNSGWGDEWYLSDPFIKDGYIHSYIRQRLSDKPQLFKCEVNNPSNYTIVELTTSFTSYRHGRYIRDLDRYCFSKNSVPLDVLWYKDSQLTLLDDSLPSDFYYKVLDYWVFKDYSYASISKSLNGTREIRKTLGVDVSNGTSESLREFYSNDMETLNDPTAKIEKFNDIYYGRNFLLRFV